MATSVDEPRTSAAVVRRRPGGLWSVPEVRWATLALVLFAVGGVLQLAEAPSGVWWTAYLFCYVAGGWEPGLAGVQALREKTLDVDLLMVVAAGGAAAKMQVKKRGQFLIKITTNPPFETK
ncbi:MAG: heavy metal translocating P-type ATPase, partial [Jatrophihabitans sp.]